MAKNIIINDGPIEEIESVLPWHYWAYCVPGGNPTTGPTCHAFYIAGGLSWYTSAASVAFHQLVGSPSQGDVIYLDMVQDWQNIPPYGPQNIKTCWVYLGSGNHFNHAQFLPILSMNSYINTGNVNPGPQPGALSQCEICDNLANPTSWNCEPIGNHPKFGYKCFEIQGTSGQFATEQDCINSGCQGVSPTKTKQTNITAFDIDDTPFNSKGEIRNFSITGDPGAVFTLTIKNETPHYYNFTSKAFQSSETEKTKIHQQVIPKNGIYKNKVVIPSISDDDHYVFQVYAESHFNTGNVLSDSLLYEKTIFQYDEVGVTFHPESKAYDSRFKTMPSDLVITRSPSKTVNNNHPTDINTSGSTDISWVFESNPSGTDTFALKEVRQPLETDYEIYQAQTVDGAITSATTSITLDSLGDLFTGMYFTGTGVDLDSDGNAPTIISINKDTKTITASTAQNGISDGAGLIFWGGGKKNIEQFSDIKITFSDISLKMDPLSVKVNGATTTSRNITLDDAGGVRVDSSMEIEGIGFDNSTTQRTTAINYSTKVMQVTSNQTLEDNTILNIKGIGKKATLTTKVNINKMPSSNLTIQFNVDAILTAATS